MSASEENGLSALKFERSLRMDYHLRDAKTDTLHL